MFLTSFLQWFFFPQPWLLLPLSILVLSILLLFFFPIGRNPPNLPPSPPMLPIIGNLHQIGALPHRSLHSLSQKHGPIMFLKLGQVPAVVVSSPDLAREVLRTHDHALANRPSYKAGQLLMYGQRNVSFAFYGDQWRKVKKVSIVHLLSSKSVMAFRPAREEEVARMVARIKSSSSSSSGAAVVVDLSDVLYGFANGTVIRAATGAKAEDGDRTARRVRELVDEATVLLQGFQIDDVFPSLGWIGAFTGMDAKLRKLFQKWDAFLNEIVDNHAVVVRADNSGAGDFVDVLLSLQKEPDLDFALTKDEIKAIVMDVNAAGTDTTYVVLVWAMAELIRNPEAMRKATEEVRAVAGGKPTIDEDDLGRTPYLKAVIKEAMRVHPPAPLLIPHESTEEVELGGYKIPPKTRVLVNIWTLAMDPASWDSPEQFRPERFLDGGGRGVVDFRGQDFEFLPFGSGRRMCPGVQFAVAVLELALANLLFHFDWSLPGGESGEDLDMTEGPGVSVRRAQPLRVVATPTPRSW